MPPQQAPGAPQGYPQQGGMPGYGQPQAPPPPQQQFGAPAPMQPPQQFGAPAPMQAPPQFGAPAPMQQYQQPGAPGMPGAMPGAAPGASPPAQQQQQGGVNMPSFSMGGGGAYGMPRIGLGGGDFSPGKLMAAITTGQGFQSPRKMGAIMVGLAMLLAIANSVMIFVVHIYYPYLYAIGAIFWWAGLWLLLTGQPRAREDGGKAPGWSRAGLAVAFGMGVIVGALMCILNWEAWIVTSATQ
jgi:hypothetical protein